MNVRRNSKIIRCGYYVLSRAGGVGGASLIVSVVSLASALTLSCNVPYSTLMCGKRFAEFLNGRCWQRDARLAVRRIQARGFWWWDMGVAVFKDAHPRFAGKQSQEAF